MKNLTNQSLIAIALFALALLAPASQFAAETGVDPVVDNSMEYHNLLGEAQTLVVAETLEQSVALRRMLADQNLSTPLDDLKGGFTIECSERFDNKCKVIGTN